MRSFHLSERGRLKETKKSREMAIKIFDTVRNVGMDRPEEMV